MTTKATHIRLALDAIVRPVHGYEETRLERLIVALCALIDDCPDVEVADLRALLQTAKERLL